MNRKRSNQKIQQLSIQMTNPLLIFENGVQKLSLRGSASSLLNHRWKMYQVLVFAESVKIHEIRENEYHKNFCFKVIVWKKMTYLI